MLFWQRRTYALTWPLVQSTDGNVNTYKSKICVPDRGWINICNVICILTNNMK